MGMTLEQLRAAHPLWTIERDGDRIECRFGGFRVRAADADEADREIRRREYPWAVQDGRQRLR